MLADVVSSFLWTLVLTAPATLLVALALGVLGGCVWGVWGALIGAAAGAGLGFLIDTRWIAFWQRGSTRDSPGWRAGVLVAAGVLAVLAALACAIAI